MMPIINKIDSLDEKDYYMYLPGTTHYDEDRFGNPVFVKDYYYLDNNFNRLIMQCNKDNIEEFAKKYIEAGKDILIGSHAPLIETKHGDLVPYSNPDIKGIWERPTKEQLLKYRSILEVKETNRHVKELA